MILRLLFCIITLGAFSCPCLGSMALRGKSFSPEEKKEREEVDFSHHASFNNQEKNISSKDVARYVPTRASGRYKGQKIMQGIGRNVGNAIMKSEFITESFLFKTARKVENTAKLDVSLKANPKKTKTKKGEIVAKEIDHKFKFDLQALRKKAQIRYSGYFDSRVEYQAKNDTVVVSLEEKLSKNSRIALSHIKDRRQSRQLLNYQFNW